MKTYKELKNDLFEEVSKIDISKLSLSSFGGGLKDYVELLIRMADMPAIAKDEIDYNLGFCGFGGAETPKIDKSDK